MIVNTPRLSELIHGAGNFSNMNVFVNWKIPIKYNYGIEKSTSD